MQIVLSPAKLMDFDGADDSVKAIDPLFTDKTAELVAVCREMSVDEIAASMNINPQMAHDVFGYFQTCDLPVAPRRAAALAYNGIAYKGLNAHDFSNFSEKSFPKDIKVCTISGAIRLMHTSRRS